MKWYHIFMPHLWIDTVLPHLIAGKVDEYIMKDYDSLIEQGKSFEDISRKSEKLKRFDRRIYGNTEHLQEKD
jgi:hypothetical protein